MMLNYRRASFSFLIMAMMVMTSFVVLSSGRVAATNEIEQGPGEMARSIHGVDPATRIDPALMEKMQKSDGPFEVRIFVSDRGAVNDVLRSNGLRELKGYELKDIPTPSLMSLTSEQIINLGKCAGTSYMTEYSAPVFEEDNDNIDLDLSEFEKAPPEIEDYDVDYLHGAVDAWSMGYLGEDVKIAIIDTGMDMAHPDLLGQQARYDSGVYAGWPIAYDAAGAYAYAYGEVGGWIADTSYEATESGGYIEFDGSDYYVEGILSVSGVYHIGYHTDANLAYLWDSAIGVLVTDSSVSGEYDTVYVDVDCNFDFTNDKPCMMGDETSYFDFYDSDLEIVDWSSWDAGDGYPDLSGGMVYWISDGVNDLPGAWIYGSDGIPNNGDLVGFVGEFGLWESHGTMTSSAALGSGASMEGMLTGMAPEANLIAIPLTGDEVASWLFAERGADNTGDSGDDADICSNSYGWSENAIWSAYDYNDLVAGYISGFMGGNTLWMWSTGNGGPGYGTTHTVTDFNSVHVGAGTTMQYRYALNYEQDYDYTKWGDVVPFSNSGPGRNGKLNAEIIASGAYSIEPMPLNSWDYFGSIGDGFMHFQIGSGTSHATPTVAGGAALGYSAHYWWNGYMPDYDYAKAVLMATADDMHFDPFKQGTGWLNASTFTKAMGAMNDGYGVTHSLLYSGWNEPMITKSALYPGYVYGNRYETYPNFLLPGEVDDSHYVHTVNYDGVDPADVNVTSKILLKSGSDLIEFTTEDEEDSYLDITSMVPATTDLLKVTMFMPLDQFDPEMDYESNVEYWLELHDWVDLDLDGIMNTTPENWELFRYTVDGEDCNYNQVMIKDPIDRTNDGLIVRIRSIIGAIGVDLSLQLDYYEMETFPWITFMPWGGSTWTTGLDFSIPIWSSYDWIVRVEVPIDAPVGTYGASIYVDYGTRVQCIPVVINVPADDYEFEFGGESYFDTTYNNEFTGLADKGWRFEVGDWRMYWCMPSVTINYNTYLVTNVSWSELPTDVNVHILASYWSEWEPYWEPLAPNWAMENIASSDEKYMGGGTFGVYTNTGEAREVVTAPLGAYIWNTGPAPFAILTRCPVMAGNSATDTLYGETTLVEIVDYSPGSVYLDAEQPGPIPLTGTYAGEYEIITSNPIEVNGGGIGPFEEEYNSWLEIWQDSLTGDFVYDLANADFTWVLEIYNCPELIITTYEAMDASDVDLALWYDENLDYVADLSEPYWYIGVDGSYEVLDLEAPADGQYLIKVLGYSITGTPGYFDLVIDMGMPGQITIVDLESPVSTGVYEFNISYNIPGRVGVYWGIASFGFGGADDTIEIPFMIDVSDVGAPSIDNLYPADGEAIPSNSLMVSFYVNDYTNFYSGFDSSSLEVYLDEYFWITDWAMIDDANVKIEWPIAIAEGEHSLDIWAADVSGNWAHSYTTFIVNSWFEMFTAEFADTGTGDTITDTRVSATEVTVRGWTDPYSTITVESITGTYDTDADMDGYYEVTPVELAEGLNIMSVMAVNDAGVESEIVKMIESDTYCMLLLQDYMTSTNDPTVYLRGWTDSDATLTVDSDPVTVMPDGTFEAEVMLDEGDNVFAVEAVDMVGNMAEQEVTIVLDTIAPTITILEPDDGATVYEPAVRVVVTIDDIDVNATILINGAETERGYAAEAVAVVALEEGSNTITVTSKDALGNTNSTWVMVTYEPVYVTFDDLQTLLDDMQNQLDDLVTEDEGLLDEITMLQDALDELQSMIEDDIGAVNESLLQEIEDLQNQIDDLQSQVNEDVNDVNTRVDDTNSFASLLMYASIGMFALAIVLLVVVWVMMGKKIQGGGSAGEEPPPPT